MNLQWLKPLKKRRLWDGLKTVPPQSKVKLTHYRIASYAGETAAAL